MEEGLLKPDTGHVQRGNLSNPSSRTPNHNTSQWSQPKDSSESPQSNWNNHGLIVDTEISPGETVTFYTKGNFCCWRHSNANKSLVYSSEHQIHSPHSPSLSKQPVHVQAKKPGWWDATSIPAGEQQTSSPLGNHSYSPKMWMVLQFSLTGVLEKNRRQVQWSRGRFTLKILCWLLWKGYLDVYERVWADANQKFSFYIGYQARDGASELWGESGKC